MTIKHLRRLFPSMSTTADAEFGRPYYYGWIIAATGTLLMAKWLGHHLLFRRLFQGAANRIRLEPGRHLAHLCTLSAAGVQFASLAASCCYVPKPDKPVNISIIQKSHRY